jgi:hypothetical protein
MDIEFLNLNHWDYSILLPLFPSLIMIYFILTILSEPQEFTLREEMEEVKEYVHEYLPKILEEVRKK